MALTPHTTYCTQDDGGARTFTFDLVIAGRIVAPDIEALAVCDYQGDLSFHIQDYGPEGGPIPEAQHVGHVCWTPAPAEWAEAMSSQLLQQKGQDAIADMYAEARRGAGLAA